MTTLVWMRFAVVPLFLTLAVAACSKVSPEEPFSGTATLRWDPVKTDTSGKTLTNFGGYKIRYGTSASAMWYMIDVRGDPNKTTYVVKDLYPGTWYFAVSAYTTSGAEGDRSNVASKAIR